MPTPPASLSTPRRYALAVVVLSGALAAWPVDARICYTVYDAKDGIVYRDWTPPFDGAVDFGSPAREALRSRGEHLVWFDAEHCAPVSSSSTPGGGRSATVDEIVAGFASYSRPTPGITGSGGRGGVSAAAPAGAGPVNRVVAPAQAATQARAASYR